MPIRQVKVVIYKYKNDFPTTIRFSNFQPMPILEMIRVPIDYLNNKLIYNKDSV